ncbi:MAG: aminotransferase class IV family protein [Chromatiales bacterium]|nr:aminotransferase class IV family protein [Chromatiales bacterium]
MTKTNATLSEKNGPECHVGRRSFMQIAGGMSAAALMSTFAASATQAGSGTTGKYTLQRNGVPVDVSSLKTLAFAGFAHATYFQVRNSQVRGIDLHLKRLREASMKMFGASLPDEQIQNYMRAAIEAGPPDLSLMATVFSPTGEFTVGGANDTPEILVGTVGPSSGPSGPLSLAIVEYERDLPEVKHVGEVGKTYYMRQAVAQGFDDAAFMDRHGRLSEGTIWNLAFWDGEAVIWPKAAMLLGTSMSIVRRQLDRLGIPQRTQEVTLEDLPKMSGAVVMNSWTPGIPVNRIGSVAIPEAPKFLELLHQAFKEETPTSL